MGLLEDRAVALDVRLKPNRASYDIALAQPELTQALVAHAPPLREALQTLTSAIPVPKGFRMDADQPFYRLGNHNRSFCYAVNAGDDLFASPTIVIKGAEPLLPDYDALIDWMVVAPFRKSSRVMADHFPLAEGKVPGALSLQEAQREGHIATEIQLAHLHAYGELARFPTPLFVHALPQPDNEACLALLKARLAPAAFDRVELPVRHGLGIHVYHFPASPVRANNVGGSARLRSYLSAHCSPDTSISGWLTLLARLLHLGYLPCTPRNEGLGGCMDFGNATLDGGFCDPDSIEPIADCPDDEFFFESIARSLVTMQSTVARVVSPGAGLESVDLYPGIEPFVIARYVCREFERALEREARPGLTLDKRVQHLLSPTNLAEVTGTLARRNRPRAYAQFLNQRSRA